MGLGQAEFAGRRVELGGATSVPWLRAHWGMAAREKALGPQSKASPSCANTVPSVPALDGCGSSLITVGCRVRGQGGHLNTCKRTRSAPCPQCLRIQDGDSRAQTSAHAQDPSERRARFSCARGCRQASPSLGSSARPRRLSVCACASVCVTALGGVFPFWISISSTMNSRRVGWVTLGWVTLGWLLPRFCASSSGLRRR